MFKLIMGLGNPGPRYEKTRHNVGHWFIQALCDVYSVSLKLEPKFKSQVGLFTHPKGECRLLISTDYMNLSGHSLASVARFYKIAPEEILVAHDELDFNPGIIRLKAQGGHGGHNGLRSIFSVLGSQAFYRLRIGIGHPGNKDEVADFVLAPPSQDDRISILHAIKRGVTQMDALMDGQVQKVMQLLHED